MKVGEPKQVKAQGKLALKNTPPTKDNGMKMVAISVSMRMTPLSRVEASDRCVSSREAAVSK